MKSARRIVCIYIAVAVIWIITSDYLLSSLVIESEQLTWISIIKGLFYVLTTGLLLYLLIRSEMNHKNRLIRDLEKAVILRDGLIQEVHHRVKNNLQNIISIIHIETDSGGFTEATRHKILNKLHALSAVHDVVYKTEGFMKISLPVVLDNLFEHRRLNRQENLLDLDPDIEYPVELMVSLILCINELFQIFEDSGIPFSVTIKAKDCSHMDIFVHHNPVSDFKFVLSDVFMFLDASQACVIYDKKDQGSDFCITFNT